MILSKAAPSRRGLAVIQEVSAGTEFSPVCRTLDEGPELWTHKQKQAALAAFKRQHLALRSHGHPRHCGLLILPARPLQQRLFLPVQA